MNLAGPVSHGYRGPRPEVDRRVREVRLACRDVKAKATKGPAVTVSIKEVNATGSTRADEMRLLQLALDGDENAFGELTGPYRAELRAHGYRMTGSLYDADDALQDGLLRAWRNLARFEGRGSMRSWLYAIVTNAALDLIRHRSRRELPVAFGSSADPGADLEPPLTDQPWLEPYPDNWLTGDALLTPEARYEQRESVELAFLVALQHLPPLQRSVLLLREVVGFSTTEIASQLGTSPQAVNSALQRARTAARNRLPARSQQSVLRALGEERTRAIVERYADAIQRGDADTLISMLTRDATWSMPPVPSWYRGKEVVREFLIRNPFNHRWQHRPARANGQLALGCYIFHPARGKYVAAVIDVLTLDGAKIAASTGFMAADLFTELPSPPDLGVIGADSVEAPARGCWVTGAELFSRFRLPAELP
jgi:RNA polymerase sigma-70 factor, ECF subfamily